MKRTSTEAPYLSWCLTVRNCEATLEATLRSIRERTPQAEIVVIDTCSRDGTPEIAQRYADVFEVWSGPRGDWDAEMFAVDDMAVARQRSFELAHGRWRGWIDGDDRLPSPDEAARLLELNGRRNVRRKGQKELEPETAHDDQGATGLEDLLRWLEANQPEVTMLYCPYLYRRDENGLALIWQERERIARWDSPPKFRWAEPAHEVLVPIGGYLPPRIELPGLLFVHEKDWTAEADDYSRKRHAAIMLRQYESGDVTYRRCRYLAGFAVTGAVDPSRELEFLERGLEVAWTTYDRYRGLIDLSNYLARRGQPVAARERVAAAIELFPDVPDAYYAAGAQAFEAEDWATAARFLRGGVACELDPKAETSPRSHVLEQPSLLALALQRYGQQLVAAGLHDLAAATLKEAYEVAERVMGRAEVGPDQAEAQALYLRAHNRYRVHRAALALREAWDVLRSNDEPQKALALLKAFPHSAEDHPIAVELQTWARKIVRHVEDPIAYRKFYASSEVTGYVPLSPEQYTYEHAQPRVRWLVDEVANLATEQADPLRVLEIGCCDGIVGRPLLEQLGSFVHYYGVDVSQAALANFQASIEACGWDLAAELEPGEWPTRTGCYDIVIVGEIVEHVPEPADWLGSIRRGLLAPGGTLLLTTPWGSFDEGHPPEQTAYGTPRDDRGHLRAYSVPRMLEDLQDAMLAPDEVARLGTMATIGHAMVVRARPLMTTKRPVIAAVRGALWDWNGSSVDADGIGASEEMIVRLGELTARERSWTVCGPVPEEEVYRGVAYLRREAVRRVAPAGGPKLLVSRAPSYVQHVDRLRGDQLDAVLWLQDTHYPDLTPELAERYEAIVCVSEWHKRLTAQAHGVPLDKIHVAYNFVQPEHFEDGIRNGWQGIKKADHFVYASSPDRGLIKLLQLWPRVLAMLPEATLTVLYGFRGAARLGGGLGDPSWTRRYLEVRREYERLRWQRGVQEVGLVNHYRVALEYQRAGVWAYPTDFHETGCLSAVKAQAGGAVPVCSALAALNETAAGFTIDAIDEDGTYHEDYDDAFLEAVRLAVSVPVSARQTMARAAIERFGFNAIKPVWDRLLG